jgi:hypothetical protein
MGRHHFPENTPERRWRKTDDGSTKGYFEVFRAVLQGYAERHYHHGTGQRRPPAVHRRVQPTLSPGACLQGHKRLCARVPANFDLDTLFAAKYDRTTDNCDCGCGCFSFHNYTFQVDSPRPPVKRHIVFLFNEKIGIKAYYDKTYYGVKF